MINAILSATSSIRPDYPTQAAPEAPPASVGLAADTVTLHTKPTAKAAASGDADHDGDSR